ncbi:MAG: hypothetical protein WBP64_08255 [Nitrososphaeraceae archaeon]
MKNGYNISEGFITLERNLVLEDQKVAVVTGSSSGRRTLEKEIKKLIPPVNKDSDDIRGSVDSPLNIVEYGDYECPNTGVAYPILFSYLIVKPSKHNA